MILDCREISRLFEKNSLFIQKNYFFEIIKGMNTLLAGGEVPGLFEGEEYTGLMNEIKQGVQRNGLIMDTEEELYKWFTQQGKI